MSSDPVVSCKTSLELSSVICTATQSEWEILVFVTVLSSISGPVPSGEGASCMSKLSEAPGHNTVQRTLPPSASTLARYRCPDLVHTITGHPWRGIGRGA
mgnify:CR=1 FL=1